jgi:AAA15 family ATPase/GTPase
MTSTGLQVVCRPNGDLGMVNKPHASIATRTDNYRDESFNSITGLNGSGKSNILDAICFVLGITNMTTVRAQNLQVRTSASSFNSD